jgi:hypothetical protein
MSDEQVDYLGRDASSLKWVELTAKLVGSEPTEE